TGELGWELHHPAGYNRHLVDLLLKAGVKPFGLEALESMRLEKSYRAINREICKDMTPFEADLGRFVAFKEKIGGQVREREFIGKDALLKQKETGEHHVLATVKLPFCDTSVIAFESVWKNGEIVGRVTSGGFSYYMNHDVAMVLVPKELAARGTELQVKISNELRNAVVVEGCIYDPTSARARA
ncbi:MAG: glycine cleavage T C-terminal barrel domain-containing protein, partial [Pseudomonadota bacterium]